MTMISYHAKFTWHCMTLKFFLKHTTVIKVFLAFNTFGTSRVTLEGIIYPYWPSLYNYITCQLIMPESCLTNL